MSEPRREERRPGPGVGMRPGGSMGMPMGPKPKLKDAKGTLRRLLGYLGSMKVRLIVVILLAAVSTGTTVWGTRINGSIIDELVATRDVNRLAASCGLLLGLYVLGIVVQQVINYLMIDVSMGTVTTLRRDLFRKMQALPLKFFDATTHGDLMSRYTNDVENVRMVLSQSLGQFIGNIISIAFTIVAMLWLSPVMTLVTVASVPLMMLVTRFIARHTRRYFSAQQKELGELNGYIEETISGQKVVKVFAREARIKEGFASINARLRTAGMRAQIFSGLMGPVMNMINNLSYAIVTTFGAWMILRGDAQVTVGVVFSFLLYLRMFGRPVNEIAQLFSTIQSALAGAERIFDVMDQAAETPDAPDAPAYAGVTGHVQANDVHFSYESGRPVLKNATFEAKPGQTIALVGPTGAGKTTIVNLLERFYDVDSGSIAIDGVDLRAARRKSLRASLGIVLQDTVLFSETVRENIRYGRLTASDAEVEAAARMANAEPFILRLPHGYDTVLGDDGGNLSQGQRQLLAIARAILADPAILILDEATSSVDTRTELHIQQAMLELMRGRTSFVIAHRLSTIRNADQILVINQGEIVERGTHEELLAAGGFYANLHNSQFRTGLVESDASPEQPGMAG